MIPKSRPFPVRRVGAVSIAFVLLAAQVMPAQPTTAEGEEAETQPELETRQLADMQRLADTVRVTTGEDEPKVEAKLIDKPLYRFGDLKRSISDGTVWAWGTSGRPVLMAEFHVNDQIKPQWGQWLVATSDVPVAAEIGGHGRWATRETEFKLLPITDLESPAESEMGRLRQMKRFARTLSASSEWKEQQFELRLLPTEVYRYSNAEQGLVDGAVFVFAVDGNPEAILFVEAHRDKSGEAAWSYALARMSAASLTFRHGDAEVWAVPQSFGDRSAPHYAFTRTVPPAASPD